MDNYLISIRKSELLLSLAPLLLDSSALTKSRWPLNGTELDSSWRPRSRAHTLKTTVTMTTDSVTVSHCPIKILNKGKRRINFYNYFLLLKNYSTFNIYYRPFMLAAYAKWNSVRAAYNVNLTLFSVFYRLALI